MRFYKINTPPSNTGSGFPLPPTPSYSALIYVYISKGTVFIKMKFSQVGFSILCCRLRDHRAYVLKVAWAPFPSLLRISTSSIGFSSLGFPFPTRVFPHGVFPLLPDPQIETNVHRKSVPVKKREKAWLFIYI